MTALTLTTQKNKYNEQGFVILRQALSADDIAQLGKLVDPILEQWHEHNRQGYQFDGLLNMHSLSHPEYFDAQNERLQFFDAIANKTLVDAMESLFGPEISFHNTQVFFNPSKPEQKPYWHRDMQYSPIADEVQAAELPNMLSLHVRIPLTEETGLKILPGTHKRWDTELERKVRLELEGHTQDEDLPGANTLHLMPGDVLIFNAQMIHQGIYCNDESRKALDLCLGAPHPLTTPFLDTAVLPNEDELAGIKHPQWFQRALLASKQVQSPK